VYLTYTPISTGPANTYEGCFRKLGFKIELSTVKIRDNFKRDLKYHVDDSDLKYLREGDNVQAFKTMTAEFLNQHGLEYWGPSQRGHLQEQDPQKGFLCPRDANRTPSVLVLASLSFVEPYTDSAKRLVQTLQATFNFKAKRCVETKVSLFVS